MNPQNVQEREQVDPAKSGTNLVEQLSRIFKLCIYYPEGNVLLEQTVEKFISILQSLIPANKSIKITFDKEHCFVEQQVVASDSSASKELHKLFSNLGMRLVEIDKKVIPDHLIYFVKQLLAWRIESEASKGFASFNGSRLPVTIRIQQQNFVVGKDAGFTDVEEEGDSTSVEEICQQLSEQGLGGVEVDQCKELLLTLSKPSQVEHLQTSKFPNATWQDVQALLMRVFSKPQVSGSGKKKTEKQSDVNAISSIFESLGRGLEDEKSKEAIELLLTHLQSEAQESESYEAVKKVDVRRGRKSMVPHVDVMSIEQLHAFVYENAIPQKIQKNLTKVDRSEEFSIKLQLYICAEAQELRGLHCEQISLLCQIPLSDREQLVLAGGIQSLSEGGDEELLTLLLAEILPLLRKHSDNSSILLLSTVFDRVTASGRNNLWPFLLNELFIVGYHDDSAPFVGLLERAAKIPVTAMYSMTNRLVELELFKKKVMAANIFNSPCRFSYPMFCVLLDAPFGKIIAQKVLEGCIREPQDELITIIAPMLDLEQEEHFSFLKNYLTQAHHDEAPLVLRMAAGQIIVRYLANVAEPNKEEDRLSEIILSTVELYCRQTKEVLERIVNEKKFGMLHIWPKDCRKAASKALKKLQRKKL